MDGGSRVGGVGGGGAAATAAEERGAVVAAASSSGFRGLIANLLSAAGVTTPTSSSSSSSSSSSIATAAAAAVTSTAADKSSTTSADAVPSADASNNGPDKSSFVVSGVTENDKDDGELPYRLVEVYLGLRDDVNEDDDDDDATIPNIEDVCPVPDAVFDAFRRVLEFAWSDGADDGASGVSSASVPTAAELSAASQRIAASAAATEGGGGAGGSRNDDNPVEGSEAAAKVAATTTAAQWKHHLAYAHRNDFEECQRRQRGGSASRVTLEGAVVAARVTRWFRHLLELSLHPTLTAAQVFLQQDDDNGNTNFGLLRALYRHVQDLPRLQGMMHRFTVQLQQQQASSSSSAASSATAAATTRQLSDPTARLKQYEAAQQVSQRLQREWDSHLHNVQIILGEFYANGNAKQRVFQRRCLGHVWETFLGESTASTKSRASVSSRTQLHQQEENTSAAALPLTLSLLHRILLGMAAASASATATSTSPDEARGEAATCPLRSTYRHLLLHVLIPLHKPNQLVLWRDQMPVLQLYHELLTKCVAVLLNVDPQLIPLVMEQICTDTEIFPAAGNTPKQVLLLHELDSYVGLVLSKGMSLVLDEWTQHTTPASSWFYSLLHVLGRCMGSDHSRVSERALEYFQNRAFVRLVQANLDVSLQVLLPHLVKKEPSWNPTVRKRTYLVLKKLRNMDEAVFTAVSNRLFGSDRPATESLPPAHAAAPLSPSRLVPTSNPEATRVPKDLSLKAGMGSWRPPTASASPASSAPAAMARRRLPPRVSGPHGSNTDGEHLSMPPPLPPSAPRGQLPPSTITGVAPWATKNNAAPPRLGRGVMKQAPPVTVTGVAPWAVQSSSSTPPVTVTGVAPWAVGSAPGSTASSTKRRALDAHVESNAESGASASTGSTGLDVVLACMKLIEPPDSGEDGVSSWSKMQMSETPTLLPNLKFHDLVFGHDLGKGAFGCVRYARLIDRSKTRSYWAEYAVKVIATDKIRELGYEASVQREIAVLRILSHPGIARLVSSFRFREGAYLVLEYASGGDLHHLLRKHGSLDHESTRFVMGEVVAALSSIHDLGLVYSDLKTENILVTETGHIKLTDMGACRPVTAEAKELIQSISRGLLKNLRDGDWKSQKRQGVNSEAEDCDDKELEDDARIEGTISYLPVRSFGRLVYCILSPCFLPLLHSDASSPKLSWAGSRPTLPTRGRSGA
jgi:Protein kinase domain/Protein phosphatase 2A regulatory B subunit (B56 family)